MGRLRTLACTFVVIFSIGAVPFVFDAPPASAHPKAPNVTSGSGASCSTPRPTRDGRFLGIVGPDSRAAEQSACPTPGTGTANGSVLPGRSNGYYNGSPPLINNGGPVMGASGNPGAIEITPIYWDPENTVGAAYESVINGFLSNMAADSGKLTNVFSAELQYAINYSVSAGAPIIDTDAFPADGCTVD